LDDYPLERLAEVPQFSWLLQYGKPWLRSAAEENREGPMMQKSQKTRDESIGGTKTIYRSGADSIVRGDVSELSYILDNVLINVY